ncbi:MAG TPA: hypothetical protein VIX42_06425 [Edaphobacter sp.]
MKPLRGRGGFIWRRTVTALSRYSDAIGTIISSLLLIATAALAVYAALQWRDTNETLKEIKQQTPEVIKSADSAKKSADVAEAAAKSSDASMTATLQLMKDQVRQAQNIADSAKRSADVAEAVAKSSNINAATTLGLMKDQVREAQNLSTSARASQELAAKQLFLSERPQILIIEVPPLSLPAVNGIEHVGFGVSVENRGRLPALNTIVVGHVIFQRANEHVFVTQLMKSECARPSPFSVGAGMALGPGEKKFITASADYSYKNLLDSLDSEQYTDASKLLSGIFVGCVIYSSELSDKALHTAFFDHIGGRLDADFLIKIDKARNSRYVDNPLTIEPSQFNWFPDSVIDGYFD